MRRLPTLLKKLAAPASLRYQLLSRSLLLLAALFVVIGISQYFLMKDFLYNNRAEALQAQLSAIPINMPDPRFGQKLDSFLPQAPDMPLREPRQSSWWQPDNLSLAYIAADGGWYELTDFSAIAPPMLSSEQYHGIMQQLMQRANIGYTIAANVDGVEQLLVFRLAGPPGKAAGILQAGSSTDELDSLLLMQLAIFGGLSLLALIAGLSLQLTLLKRTLQPLSRLVTAARETDARNMARRFPIQQGQQEIDRLADAFNDMLGRLEQAFEGERKSAERMRRFVADASHELRTPLTSIHGFIEVLLRGAATQPDQLHRALESMQLESGRMNRLIADLLALAKLDQGKELVLSPQSLNTLLQEMEPQLQLLAGERSLTITVNSGKHYAVNADSDKLKQVILNLFMNAVQHTDAESGAIAIVLTEDKEHISLTVSDNGNGIPAEHLPYLFERFYRSDSSRTRQNGGAGLGLAISEAIVKAHGGTMMAESELGRGSSFRILLPVLLPTDKDEH